MTTKIEWTDEVWNPVTGCTKISEGCTNCYAERMTKRLAGRYGYPKNKPFGVTVHSDKLAQPLLWKRPRRVFVCSMGDLFHDDVPGKFIGEMTEIMHTCKQHTFILLTKRTERMKSFFGNTLLMWGENIWIGVTAENQRQADERIPILLQIPAEVLFVSVEPMLGEVDLSRYLDMGHADWREGINWVICGGESGPGARPMHPDWVRSVRDQCQAARVPFFFKQWGEWVQDCEGSVYERVGKKRAGRLLEGVEYNESPNQRACERGFF